MEELSFGQLEELLWKSTLSLFQHVMVEVLVNAIIIVSH